MERKLVRPHSMDEALSQREQHGMDALPIAGGQSLLVMLRNKLIDPKILLDLESIGELRGLQRQSSGVSIGAMTTFFELLSSAEVQNAAAGACVKPLPKSARPRFETWAPSAAIFATTSPVLICHRRCWCSMPRLSYAAARRREK